MSNRTKIINVIACVIVIATVFCISSFAFNSGETLPAGTQLIFNNTLSYSADSTIYFNFSSYNNSYSYLDIDFRTSNKVLSYVITTQGGNQRTEVYNNGTWSNDNYKTITLTQDYTLNSSAAAFFTANATIYTPPSPPPPPPPTDDILEKVKETFSSTLTFGTLIISWLVANQIALAGLYLYILISLIAVMKRFFVT